MSAWHDPPQKPHNEAMESLQVGLSALALAAALASPAGAQVPSCTADAGPATAITGDFQSSAPLEIVVAENSATFSHPFWVKDAQGRPMRNVEVEFTLPESPPSLVFIQGDGAASPTPKRAIASTLNSCTGYRPRVMVGSANGTVMATARVLTGPTFSTQVPVRIVTGRSPVHLDRGPPIDVVALNGSTATAGASAEWSDGTQGGPLAGVPITFTALSSTMIARFVNGSDSIVVITDAFGRALAPLSLTSGPGVAEVRATYPDGALAISYRYIALDTPVVELASTSLAYGSRTAQIQGRVRYAGFPCELASSSYLLRSSARVVVDGVAIDGFANYPTQCTAGAYEATITSPITGIPFGEHEARAEVFGHYLIPAATSPASRITIEPAASVASSTGRGSLRLGAADPEYASNAGVCTLDAAQAAPLATGNTPASGPAGVDLPYGALRFELAACNWNSTWDGVPPPSSPPAQRVLIEAPENLAPGTVAWAFGPTSQDPSPHWYELRTTVLGRFAQFEVVDAGPGDDSLTSDRVIHTMVALGAPRYSAIPQTFQDLWWAGPIENGWGMSITQHRDMIFAALFVYDAAGDPRWLVLPGGRWNDARTEYSGDLYRPKGSPISAYDAAAFRVGSPVGGAKLKFTAYGSLTLEYVIDGVAGSKQLTRQGFGPPHPFPLPRFDDLWWGGMAQNGWGFALAQQFQTLFGVLYAYDAQGDTTWLVAPDIRPRYTSRHEGKLYRTRGPSWPGAPYDATRLSVTEAGSLYLAWFDGWETGFFNATLEGGATISKDLRRQPF
jgi:hypothetical protein